MDVDTIQATQLGRLSPEEQRCLRNEGRCFFCKQQGHISHACPKKGRTGAGNPQSQARPTMARTTEVIEAPTAVNATAPLNRQAIMKGLQGLSAEERGYLLDELITSDQSSSSF
jgi:hypothetical protein